MRSLLLLTRGGFNDQLSVIATALVYCKAFNRVLFVDTRSSPYRVDIGRYCTIPGAITDEDQIEKCIAASTSMHPKCLNGLHPRYLSYVWKATTGNYCFGEQCMMIPTQDVDAELLVSVQCGQNIRSPPLFQSLSFTQHVKEHVQSRAIAGPYTCIQVRNTDITCDYAGLYEQHQAFLHSCPTIYIATDNAEVLTFFQSKGLRFINHTTFPDQATMNLHYSKVNGDTKFLDMLTDLYLIVMADRLITNSQGGFIYLCQRLREKREAFHAQFLSC